MTFDQLPAGSAVFMDANTFVYAILNHPAYGASCTALLDRIERQEVQGFTSSHVLSETAHRVMTLEACDRFGWPAAAWCSLGVTLASIVFAMLTMPRALCRSVGRISSSKGLP